MNKTRTQELDDDGLLYRLRWVRQDREGVVAPSDPNHNATWRLHHG